MAQGDITKEIIIDRIEIVQDWNVQCRQATKIMEEQADGSKSELNRNFIRFTLTPFISEFDADGKWTHTPTDLSKYDAKIKAVAEASWTDDVKELYKTVTESKKI
tara:strand:+ start:224 stop:538 length:315 start_codon:yes stop_codon:yes gene_type:complete